MKGTGGNNIENGRYRYYSNSTLKQSIPKDEIEALIIKRIKHYLANSGTVASASRRDSEEQALLCTHVRGANPRSPNQNG